MIINFTGDNYSNGIDLSQTYIGGLIEQMYIVSDIQWLFTMVQINL